MTFPLLISFRETLEAALIVSVILSSLQRLGQSRMMNVVWLGIAAGIAVSIGAAVSVQFLVSAIRDTTMELSEGITLLLASSIVGWISLWMLRQRKEHPQTIEATITSHASRGYALGLFTLSFVSVAREGIETALLLQAAFLQAESTYAPMGIAIGCTLAIAVSYGLSKGIRSLPLKTFFSVSAALLMILAVSLLIHGLYELKGSGVFSMLIATRLP